jgi:glycogen debranching enzyme
MRASSCAVALLCLFNFSGRAQCQTANQPSIINKFPFEQTVPLKIVRNVTPGNPFTVIGPRGAILGAQDGSFEAWIFPWKIFGNLRIHADVQNYPVPIDVNEQAAVIEVRPDHTTITFSHAVFTVREILFAPHNAPDGAGALAFFEIQSVRPLTLTLDFTPEMKRMWPAPSDDRSSPEWARTPDGAFYILHLNFPDHAAGMEMPGAEPGILEPYQERPKTYPLQFVLHFDPTRNAGQIFPLLITISKTEAESGKEALSKKLSALARSMQSLYDDNAAYYRRFLAQHVSLETPDQQFNDAFRWAEVSIDQLKIETTPSHDETALVAGFYGSGDSARPGFGWYFGRDALWSLYAVNSYGDFRLARDELEFLLRRQSPEGQIMHEWSQTAGLVNWKSLPYEFASADATPLFLMAADDYLKISGDVSFEQAHWDGLSKAWNFEISHDSDGDGIYENIASGWVESWFPKMPHQEIYLAALDQQASTAFASLAKATGHSQLAEDAGKRAAHIAKQIEKEYYIPDAEFYAFSRNPDGTLDTSPTIYPAVAAWDGTFNLSLSGTMLKRWASPEFSTDWGTRDLSPSVSFYDPISYHQGSVWPLFTGWVSLSEYRNGRSLSGYAHLMQNADLTWAEDLGAVTELLSGEFFRWFGRSTSHQLWSSAMVVTPTLRGMFGLEWDAGEHKLMISPHLPPQWNDVRISGLPLGNSWLAIEFHRKGSTLVVQVTGSDSSQIVLGSRTPGAKVQHGELTIPLPAVEVGIAHGLPEFGSVTSQMKVLDEHSSAHSLALQLSAPANTAQTLFLRINDPNARVKMGGEAVSSGSSEFPIRFPAGVGYVQKEVSFSW